MIKCPDDEGIQAGPWMCKNCRSKLYGSCQWEYTEKDEQPHWTLRQDLERLEDYIVTRTRIHFE